MADTVKLRNISDVTLHVPTLDRLVEAGATVEIPARLLNHQLACTGIDREFVPAEGTWRERECPGCLHWPEETWQVDEPKKTASKVKE